MSMESRRLGKYELRERLARGGMGEIWKAYDPQLRRYVAIKQLQANLQTDPDFATRFEREAQFIASLHHSNIVKIHDFQFVQAPDTERTTAYMVMDYVQGQTLADYIRNTSRKGLYPSASDIIYLFTATSLAIDYAHHKGMIHRDIKPANILLDQRGNTGRTIGEPVLTDFGIAKLQGGASETIKGTLLGTPLYISPEQAQGHPGDERSDLYSLGIILYEITTGVTPFRGGSDVAILMQHVHGMPTPPSLINPNIPPALSEVILKSIEKNPDARFSSACAMTIATAEALNVSVPVVLRRGDRGATTTTSGLTYYNPLQPMSLTPSHPFMPSAPYLTPSSPAESRLQSPSRASPNSPVAMQQPSLSALSIAAPESLPAPTPVAKKRRGLYIALAVALLVTLIGSSLAVYALLAPRGGSNPPGPANVVVGHMLFLKSLSTLSGFDEVQVDIPKIPQPASGTNYYAWLDSHNDSITVVSQPVTVTKGGVSLSLQVAQQHLNLTDYDRFLITEESTNQPVSPSLAPGARLYYASIPQAVSPGDHFRLVDHLNHLLADDPNLDKLNLQGGLNTWLQKNTQALGQQTPGANDALQQQNAGSLRQHLVNMLYYLDGQSCAPSYLNGLPAGASATPEQAVFNDTRVSLLDCPQNSVVAGYLAHIATHLKGVITAPGVTQKQVQLAQQISVKLNQINAELHQTHQDAEALVKLPDAQLLQSQTQLSDLVTQINNAYNGQAGQEGVRQIGDDLKQLASFDILQCPQSGTNNPCQ